MKEFKITQGSILNGIRSDQYPNTSCFGIVISASCDLENCKISKVYMLTALSVSQWIKQVGIKLAFEDILTQKGNALKDWAKQHGNLNFSILSEFSIEEIEKNVDHVEKPKVKEKIMRNWREFLELKSFVERSEFTSLHSGYETVTKKIKEKLTAIIKGENTHFCFLPSSAYSHDKKNRDGLVVNLLEILPFPISLIDRVGKYEIDNVMLSEEERSELNNIFYLEEPDDYVVASQLTSPWTEWLMQQFSYSFIRIGINRPTDDEIDTYCTNTLERMKDCAQQ